MPERFLRVTRGEDIVAEVALSPTESIAWMKYDPGRNIDPQTGEPPVDEEGEVLPIEPAVFTVELGEGPPGGPYGQPQQESYDEPDDESPDEDEPDDESPDEDESPASDDE